MRITLTLDEDLVLELRKRAKKTNRSFEALLNDSLRQALKLPLSSSRKMKHFQVQPHSSPFRTAVDLNKLNQLADQLAIKKS
jgi:plasmid stability protein